MTLAEAVDRLLSLTGHNAQAAMLLTCASLLALILLLLFLRRLLTPAAIRAGRSIAEAATAMRQSARALRTSAATAMPAPAAAASIPLPGELTKGLARQDREFLPAALELLETPPSPVLISGIWLISALFAATLAWAWFGKLDIHAVAQGRVQPSGRSKVIQPLEPGKVVAVMVENGARVKAGDILLELDPTETGADRQAQTRDLEAARAEAVRRRIAMDTVSERERDLRPVAVPFDAGTSEPVRRREEAVLAAELGQLRSTRANQRAQLAEKTATRDKLTASIAAREKVIALARERVEMRSTLNDQGSLSRALVIDVQSQFEQLMTQQISEKGQLIETEAAIRTVEAKIEEVMSQFVAEQGQKMAEAERKADHIAQDLVKATAKNERSTLKAPISGTVQQLAVTTVGQVVNGGQSLMTIVPNEGGIEIEALILNQDIGFVETGQDAVIKIEAFPFTRYGTIPGRIFRVSREAIDEREAQGLSDAQTATRPSGANAAGSPGKMQNLVFPATIRLDRATINIDGKDIPLSPGMAVTVEVLTGQRRAIDYVLSPIREIASSTARER